MPAQRLSMRKIREVLRLKWQHTMSDREIAQCCRVSKTTVSTIVLRAKSAELEPSLLEAFSDTELEQLLYPASQKPESSKSMPDWSWVHQQLQMKSVMLMLVWMEYREKCSHPYEYTSFCNHYKNWRQKYSMRQIHLAGDKLFVDYAGHTIPIRDTLTGCVHQAQIFVAVLGASNYTYAEATWSQGGSDWAGSHVRALEFIGGCPRIIVPDNLKSGVKQADPYDPELNRSYHDLARHYGFAVLPARVRKPKDKAKVESGVLIVERWILAALRHQTFFSLEELNQAIRLLLIQLNQRSFKKLPGNREERYQQLDKPMLQPLPVKRYEYAEWKKVRVHIDYHVEIERHYYSVPCELVKQQLDARVTAHTVELFLKGERIASHRRSLQQGAHSTHPEHRPPHHRFMSEWSPERFIQWGQKIGPCTRELMVQMLGSKMYPEQSYRGCLGVLRLANTYESSRLETACQKALFIGNYRVKTIESILKNGLDLKSSDIVEETVLPNHENIRGASYYNN
jgi:transposase